MTEEPGGSYPSISSRELLLLSDSSPESSLESSEEDVATSTF